MPAPAKTKRLNPPSKGTDWVGANGVKLLSAVAIGGVEVALLVGAPLLRC